MTDRDQHNLVRFLQDLAGASDTATARLRGDRIDPSPEATRGQKRPETGAGKRDGANSRVPRWPVRAWWHRD